MSTPRTREEIMIKLENNLTNTQRAEVGMEYILLTILEVLLDTRDSVVDIGKLDKVIKGKSK